jgi:hypothetical protein
MERRDYLMRMIEQMGAVFARVRQMLLGGTAGGAEQLNAAARRAGIDAGTARALDADSLLALLSAGGVADPTRTWLMAEFIYLDGLGLELEGSGDDALDAYRKALRLYHAIDPRIIGGITEATERIAELASRIDSLDEGVARQ